MNYSRTIAVLIGLGCLAAGLHRAVGLLGVGLAFTVAAPILSNLTPYNLAYGQVVVAATTPVASTGTLLAELGVLILFVTLLATRTTLKWAASGVLVAVSLAALARIAWNSWSGIRSAALVLAIAALVLYGVHRYETVKLGLVEPNP